MPGRMAALCAAMLLCTGAYAQLLTEKKFFALPQYTTAGGKPIKNLRIGYETYGKLNAAGDNAVFVAHFFSGTSHAAGRYNVEEKTAGYWDAIIGPGKAIDTERYFVVSADSLANLNVKSPAVGTAGPATLNPPAPPAGPSRRWSGRRVPGAGGAGDTRHPNWKGGDYFGGPEPADGVAHSLKTITLTALHFGWAEKVHGYKWAPRAKTRRML